MVTTTALPEFLTWLRSQHFTGTVTLHIRGGVLQEATWGTPNRVVFPRPSSSTPLPSSPSSLDTSPPLAVGSRQDD